MRSFLVVTIVAAVCVVVYVSLLTLSARIPALPTAHHREWVSLLDEPGAGWVHMDLIHSAMQWYERAVLFALTVAVVACGARLIGRRRSLIFAGTLLWLSGMVAMAGLPGVLDGIAVLLSVVGIYGGLAIAEDVLALRHRKPSGQ